MTGELAPDRRNLRVSHDDREQAADRLRIAAGDGRLTAEELGQRLEVALTARTYGELESVLADLPAAPQGPPGLAPAVKDLIQLRSRSGHITRNGRWAVPRRLEVEARSGHVRLDFTQAVISQPTLELALTVRSGHVQLIVPPGVDVDVDGVEMRSGHIKQRAPQQPGTPARFTVILSGQVRSGHISIRGPRRSFWAWLTGQPRPSQPALPR